VAGAKQVTSTQVGLTASDAQEVNSEALQYFNHGCQLASEGKIRQALRAFRAVTRIAPKDPAGWSNRATMAGQVGVIGEPESCYRKAITLAPNEDKYRVRLGYLLIQQARLDEADALFASAKGPHARCGRAQVLEARGAYRAALGVLEEALPHCRDFPRIGVVFARLARHLGEPMQGAALLKDLPESTETLFERGHCLDAAGLFEQAWTCFLKANRSLGAYDIGAFLKGVSLERSAQRTWTSTVDGSRMVFIVGMPRSGTSLVEQILSRHPAVTPFGERELMPRMCRELTRDGWPDLRPAQLDALANRYLAGLPERGIVTDKMPDNWQHIGLIRQLFPTATVVHCQREAHDVLVSNFMQHYATSAMGWSTSMAGLRAYHQAWSTAEIGGHEVRYEDLVSDPEEQIPRLLQLLSLPLHPACLRPHESKRAVATASYAQVKKPINTRSVGRAHAYQRFMAA
jgi:tetratricopeptide (TPR) repeat protein